MEANWIIETKGLTKVFGDKVAVSNLTLRVAPGEVFGFLGPNGAGKTTAVKMLLGLISPSSGSGSVMGAPLGDFRTRGQIGFLPEHFRFHEWLTAEEFLKLQDRFAHLFEPERNDKVLAEIQARVDAYWARAEAAGKLATP